MVEEVAQPRVSLKLRAGEREGPFFQDVLVYDLSCTLGDFLDSALKDLEVLCVCVCGLSLASKRRVPSNVVFLCDAV
jgi:hypothetical protein